MGTRQERVNSFSTSDVIGYAGHFTEKQARIVEGKAGERKIEHLDLMNLLGKFTEPELKNLTGFVRDIQTTDGCTGGCWWCGYEAKREISQAFSYNSLDSFFRQYGSYLPANAIALYRASDPLSWKDGNHTYTDLVKTFLEKTNKYTGLSTSTSIPRGTELEALRFLREAYELWENEGSDFRQAIRISVNQRNQEIVEAVIVRLKEERVTEEFIQRIERSYRTKGAIIYMGDAINNPARDYYDTVGIACFDGLVITPDGVSAVSMEAVTMESPQGVKMSKIEPGGQAVPVPLDLETYDDPIKGNAWGYKLFNLLPKRRYAVYENGDFKEVVTEESVRRDLLAFAITNRNLSLMPSHLRKLRVREAVKQNPLLLDDLVQQLDSLSGEFLERRNNYLKRKGDQNGYVDYNDKEAYYAADYFIGEVERELMHVKGIFESLKPHPGSNHSGFLFWKKAA